MSFPSMSIQQRVKLSSEIVNLGCIAFRRCERRGVSTGEFSETYIKSRVRCSHFDQIR
jgi:hypothetical protein